MSLRTNRLVMLALLSAFVYAQQETLGALSQHMLGPQSSIEWQKCGELNNHRVECATIDVPLDHFNPTASSLTFSIPLTRMLATNASANGNKTIFMQPGGPGVSGRDFLWGRGEYVNQVVGDGFHLLSFEPRAVGGSSPPAICYASPNQRTQAVLHQPWNPEYQAGEMYSGAENLAKACAEAMGEYGPYINTPQTAADMNFILDAIGQDKLYYWGISYGTVLGQTYAQMFPERVARVIIDGVVNLDKWYNDFINQEETIDTDKVYAGFVEKCFEAGEDCPLNTAPEIPFRSATDLQNYLDGFLRTLVEEPIPVYLNMTSYGAITRRNIEVNAIFSALYKPQSWPLLAKNLAELFKGNATSCYRAYSDSWLASLLPGESNAFITFNDNWKTGPNAPLHSVQALRDFSFSLQTSKLMSKYLALDIFNRASWRIPTTHSFRPRYHPAHAKVETAEPIFVLSTSFDPICPLISAKKAQRSFVRAALLEQRSYGHCTISMPSLCTAKHVRRYFTHGILPDKGATCDVDASYFPLPSSTLSRPLNLSSSDTELLITLEKLAQLDMGVTIAAPQA